MRLFRRRREPHKTSGVTGTEDAEQAVRHRLLLERISHHGLGNKLKRPKLLQFRILVTPSCHTAALSLILNLAAVVAFSALSTFRVLRREGNEVPQLVRIAAIEGLGSPPSNLPHFPRPARRATLIQLLISSVLLPASSPPSKSGDDGCRCEDIKVPPHLPPLLCRPFGFPR